MEVKVNIPLIDKISSIFHKTAERPARREETTESSLDVSVASYYYKQVQLERTRKAKYGDYVLMDEEYPEISTCLGGNTLIQTIDGPVRIKDLCSRGDVVVFTYDHCSKKICLAKTNGGAVKTGENKDVFDVSLDDGRIIRATGNHPFMMRDGSYKRVDELKPYDSLMPFYMRIGRSGYKQVFQPDEDYNARKRWGFVYRLSALYKYGLYPNRDVAVHHIDFNKLNDHPDNIEVLSKNEHGDIHFRNTRKKHGGKIPTHVWTQEERLIQSTRMCGNSFAKGNRFSDEARKLLSDQRTGVKKPEKWRMALAEANQRRKIFLDKSQMAEILSNGGTVADAARYFNVSYATAKRRRVEMFSTQRMALNHCVLKIEYAGKEDVYDLSVPGYRNFACEGFFVHNSLDLYADNATKDRNEAGDPFEVKAKDIRVQNIINEIIERTKVKEMIWDTARAMAKMGDDFDENVVNDKGLIVRLKNLEPYTMFKNVDEYGRVKEKPYVQKDEMTGVTVAEFEPWQIIHWKNGGMKKMYGESVMKSIRRVYKQLQLMEDGMVISRLTRSQLRYKILVDVEGMDKEEREDYIKKVKNEFKKKRLINPLTGKLETAQNPLTAEEDFYVGVTKESKADVGVLQGATNLGNIRDVEHFQTKLFAGLKVPKAFVGLEKDVKAKCLGLDTRIPCLDDKIQTLREIIDEYEKSGFLPYVYSWDKEKKMIVPGKVIWAGVTKRMADVVEVKLDDGTKIRCTPEHKWFLLDGSVANAVDLKRGQQLMPLRRSIRKSKSYNGYEKIYDPWGGVVLTHQRVAEISYADELSKIPRPNIHHADRNRRNNDPKNLILLSFEDHLSTHKTDRFKKLNEFRNEHGPWNKGVTKASNDPRADRYPQTTFITKECLTCGTKFTVPLSRKKKVVCSRQCAGKRSVEARGVGGIKKLCEVCGKEMLVMPSKLERKKYCSKRCKHIGQLKRIMAVCIFCGDIFSTKRYRPRKFCSIRCSNTWGNKFRAGLIPLPNHRIVSVREIKEPEDTGDITVESLHNFFVCDAGTGGVLVHNSTIVEEDIQFARTVGRIRKGLRNGLSQLFNYHLILQGIVPVEGMYQILFAPISMVDEMRKWTMEKLKAEVAKIYRVDMQILGDEFILRSFLGLSDEEIAAVLKDKPAPLTSPSPKKATTPSLRAAGATGMTTPQVGGLNPKEMVSKKEDGSDGLDRSDGFHIVTLQMMNLVETLRDLVDLELN